jgi:protein SCO1/2
MKKTRILLWGFVFVALTLPIYQIFQIEEKHLNIGVAKAQESNLSDSDKEVNVGGKFNLVDQNGVEVNEENFKDIYTLVFFGFTNCPDVCPTGLSQINLALKALGEHEEEILPVFITVDPERDTPQVLKTYLQNFGDDFVGLTGSKEQTKAVQDEYKVYSQKMEMKDAPDGYLMDHSAYIYFMGKKGEYIMHFTNKDTPENIAKKMRQYLDSSKHEKHQTQDSTFLKLSLV